MDIKKLKKEIQKLLSDKKLSSTLAVLLVLAFVLIIINFYYPKSINNNTSNDTAVPDNSIDVSDYEEMQKRELIEILRKIKGVNDVDVIMNFESGEVKVPAYDTNIQTTTTEETDKEGGKRVNNQTNDSSKVVITTEGAGDKPFILQTYKPKVIGIIVVCSGAEDSKVKHNIEVAVSNLYNLSANKVNVYPSKN